jgi:hypothetical protein
MIQLLWLTLLALHTGAAGVWWYLMPGGFPSSSTEFWVNQVAPPLIIGVLLTALFARGRFSQTILPPILAMIPMFWMAFAVSARIAFGESFGSLWNLPFFAGSALAALWARQFRFRVTPIWLTPMVAIAAAVAGWTLPGSQRAPDPATAPSGSPMPDVPGLTTDHKLIKLNKDAQLHPADGHVVIRRDKVVLNVLPMLSFSDRSPDRCWLTLAPAKQIFSTTRTLVSKLHDAARWTLFYRDEDVSVLDVSLADGAVEIDSRSRLPRPIFSHANSFAELAIQGHQELTVTFSPAATKRIAPAPVTAPARLAYLDELGVFHVMQASDQHRGPFTEIAAGPMKRTEPLVLTLYDRDKAVFRVILKDWAAQASTQLSPTAGAGIPVNAIELMRGGEPKSSPVLLAFTLAGTMIGRGVQTVGHAAGVYRDRLTISLLSP